MTPVSLTAWAERHRIGPNALNDLVATLVHGEPPTPQPSASTSEALALAAVRLEASEQGGRLWRNNVGAAAFETGGFVRYGLCNETEAMNRAVKSSDLIGLCPVRITPAMVGSIIGQFVAREIKAPGWRYHGTKREVAQLKFIEIVTALGGDAKFATGRGTL
jgi:hypothetical protein